MSCILPVKESRRLSRKKLFLGCHDASNVAVWVDVGALHSRQPRTKSIKIQERLPPVQTKKTFAGSVHPRYPPCGNWQTYLSHSTYTDYIACSIVWIACVHTSDMDIYIYIHVYSMACTCANRYIQRIPTSFNVRSRCSKVKVPLDAVLPGERPEMEKVYVDVPQIEYVLWPRWEGECSKYVKNSSTCCAFIQMSEIIYVSVCIILDSGRYWIPFLRWNRGLVESGNDLRNFKRQGRKCCTLETYTLWWAKFPRHNFEVPKEVEVPVQRQAALQNTSKGS